MSSHNTMMLVSECAPAHGNRALLQQARRGGPGETHQARQAEHRVQVRLQPGFGVGVCRAPQHAHQGATVPAPVPSCRVGPSRMHAVPADSLACAREQQRHARPTARVAGSEGVAKCDALLLSYSIPQQPVPRHLHREHLRAVHAREPSSTPSVGVSATHGQINLAPMRLKKLVNKPHNCHGLHTAAASEAMRAPWRQC